MSRKRKEPRSIVSHDSHPDNGTARVSHGHLSAHDSLLRDAQVQPFGQFEFHFRLAAAWLQALVPAQVYLELMEWRCVWRRCREISVFPFWSQYFTSLVFGINSLYPHVHMSAAAQSLKSLFTVGLENGFRFAVCCFCVAEKERIG